MDAYMRFIRFKRSSEMLMVSGQSGVGKSALVYHVQQHITELGGLFLCGKFDCFRQMEPLSAIIVALTDFCNQTSTEGEENHHQVKNALQEIVGSTSDILRDVIPTISRPFHTRQSDSVVIGANEAKYRLENAFRLFFRLITPPGQSIVLFLDDLQWADLLSLNLMKSLICDPKNKSLFVIGSYRNNEVHEAHPLVSHLRDIKNKGIKITEVEVDNLSRENVNELISDAIHSPSYLTQSLSTIVQRKTNGNPLFVLQFLKLIYDEGHLYFQVDANKWLWDISMIELKEVANNADGLIWRKIMQFPIETQHVVKVMACVGYECELWILGALVIGGFIQDEALACERAGIFHSTIQGENDIANGYFLRAYSSYEKWGAYCKAHHVRKQYSLHKYV
eukprot:13390765-Ditylum_brightwellii.AAC.1